MKDWWLLRVLICSVCLVVGGCGDDGDAGDDDDTSADDDDDDTSEPGDPGDLDRVVMNHYTVMLVGLGDTEQLVPTAYDSQDRVIDTAFTFESMNPDVIEVSSDGQVTAAAELGTSLIVVHVDGDLWSGALVYAAHPKAGALVYTDDQVVDTVDWNVDGFVSLVGMEHTVTLSGIEPPEVGTVVLPRHDTPALGLVTSTSAQGETTMVVLETAPMTALFEELVVDRYYGFHPATETFDSEGRDEFEVGAFECTAETEFGLEPPGYSAEITLTAFVQLSYVIEGGELTTAELMAGGDLHVTLDAYLILPAGWGGSVRCVQAFDPLFNASPGGGPLTKFIDPDVPWGTGFELAAELGGTDAQVGVVAELDLELEVGLSYDPEEGVTVIEHHEGSESVEPYMLVPTPEESLYAEVSAHVFTEAGLGVMLKNLPFLDADTRLDLARASFGPKVTSKIATPLGQVLLDDYRSGYDLSMAWDFEGCPAAQQFLGSMGVDTSVDLQALTETPLFHAPSGTVSADATTLAVGETVTATIAMEDLFFHPTPYNLTSVDIYEYDGVGVEIVESLAAVDPQDTFEWSWTPVAEDVGPHTFAVFADTELVPGFLLEVAEDSTFDVEVTP